jgi:hypothetical protein
VAAGISDYRPPPFAARDGKHGGDSAGWLPAQVVEVDQCLVQPHECSVFAASRQPVSAAAKNIFGGQRGCLTAVAQVLVARSGAFAVPRLAVECESANQQHSHQSLAQMTTPIQQFTLAGRQGQAIRGIRSSL